MMNKTDELMNEYTQSFIGKVFYFCLKKTGNESEAEELSSEISLAVFLEFRRGVIPNNLAGWIWQIARNHYAKWADRKHKRNDKVINADIGDIDIEDDLSIENELIRSEELSLLRRELAFITNDYRKIVVAFYIEDKTIQEISSSLDLPVGTVKSKLFRARIILKEGMSMARTFGKMSYKPENLSFCMNGLSGKNGEPWCFLTRALDKNILLAAYRTPSSAEELAMEIGIALPYMEEELETLTGASLLVRNGNKYETNFYIFSSKVQEKIYSEYRIIAPELTRRLIDIYDYKKQWLDKNRQGWHLGNQSEEDMRWAGLMEILDNVSRGVINEMNNKCDKKLDGIGKWGHTIRPNDGEWDVLGFECYDNTPYGTSLAGCVNAPEEKNLTEINFRHYTFRVLGQKYFNQDLSYREGYNLLQVVTGKLEQTEQSIIDGLIKKGFLKQINEKVVPSFCVIQGELANDIPNEVQAEIRKKTESAVKLFLPFYRYVRKCISDEMPTFISNKEYQIDSSVAGILWNRGSIVEEAMKNDYLKIPDDETRIKMLGATLTI